jgi:hypothetical protein
METSKTARAGRNSCSGRVAVAYVQGSPKGGGALCVRRVSNTRLSAGASSMMSEVGNGTTIFVGLSVELRGRDEHSGITT